MEENRYSRDKFLGVVRAKGTMEMVGRVKATRTNKAKNREITQRGVLNVENGAINAKLARNGLEKSPDSINMDNRAKSSEDFQASASIVDNIVIRGEAAHNKVKHDKRVPNRGLWMQLLPQQWLHNDMSNHRMDVLITSDMQSCHEYRKHYQHLEVH